MPTKLSSLNSNSSLSLDDLLYVVNTGTLESFKMTVDTLLDFAGINLTDGIISSTTLTATNNVLGNRVIASQDAQAAWLSLIDGGNQAKLSFQSNILTLDDNAGGARNLVVTGAITHAGLYSSTSDAIYRNNAGAATGKHRFQDSAGNTRVYLDMVAGGVACGSIIDGVFSSSRGLALGGGVILDIMRNDSIASRASAFGVAEAGIKFLSTGVQITTGGSSDGPLACSTLTASGAGSFNSLGVTGSAVVGSLSSASSVYSTSSANNGFYFHDRTTGANLWAWYSLTGTARLYSSVAAGDVIGLNASATSLSLGSTYYLHAPNIQADGAISAGKASTNNPSSTFWGNAYGEGAVNVVATVNGNNVGYGWYSSGLAKLWSLMTDPGGSADTNLQLKRNGAASAILNFPAAGTSMEVIGALTVSNGATFNGSSYPASYISVVPASYGFHSGSAGPALKFTDYSGATAFGLSVDNGGSFIIGNAAQTAGMAMTTATLTHYTHVRPLSNNTKDLGDASTYWRDLFIGRNALIGGTLGVTGALTGSSLTASTASLTGTSSGLSISNRTTGLGGYTHYVSSDVWRLFSLSNSADVLTVSNTGTLTALGDSLRVGGDSSSTSGVLIKCTTGRLQIARSNGGTTKGLDAQLNGSAWRFPMGILVGGNGDVDGATGGSTGGFDSTGALTCTTVTASDNVIVGNGSGSAIYLRFGGTSGSFAALRRSGTGLHVVSADGLGFSDLQTANFTANGAIAASGRIETTSGGTTTSQIKGGSIELQSYAVNNSWISDNIYHNGTGFFYRSAGSGCLTYYNGGDWIHLTAPTGSAGAAVTYTARLKLTNASGAFAIGGAISQVTSTFTGGTIIGDSSQNVTMAGSLTTANYVYGAALVAQSAQSIGWQSRARMFSPADGQVKLRDFADAADATLTCGAVTSSGNVTAGIHLIPGNGGHVMFYNSSAVVRGRLCASELSADTVDVLNAGASGAGNLTAASVIADAFSIPGGLQLFSQSSYAVFDSGSSNSNGYYFKKNGTAILGITSVATSLSLGSTNYLHAPNIQADGVITLASDVLIKSSGFAQLLVRNAADSAYRSVICLDIAPTSSVNLGANGDIALKRFAASKMIVDNYSGSAGVLFDVSTDGTLKLRNRADSAYADLGVKDLTTTGTIYVGHASDTPISRYAAGAVGLPAYIVMTGTAETFQTFISTSNTSGQRVMRFGNKLDTFRLDKLNDAGSLVTTDGIITVSNAAPAGSLAISSTGTVSVAGAITPATLADSAAPNGSIYYSSDASKLVFKDAGGVVHDLY